jgi:hypothetical protein
MKEKTQILRKRVKETQDQTNKVKVDTDRLAKINDKISKIPYLTFTAERNQENMAKVTKLNKQVKPKLSDNTLMTEIIEKLQKL